MNKNLIEKLSKILTKKNLIISTAESCTGGFLANKITNISGSSKYFLGGIITYSNACKTSLLNVDRNIIDKNGAVSAEVAYEMAKNVKEKFKTDLAISTTGIAGPTDATKEKPIGTVYIGFANLDGIDTKLFHFSGNRLQIKEAVSKKAIEWILNWIKINFNLV